MYLCHFGFNSLPFSLTPDTGFYCDLNCGHEALAMLQTCLNEGEGFISLSGEVGLGKTLLCRRLLANLDKNYVAAYIPSPSFTPAELRSALARELGVKMTQNAEVLQHRLVERLSQLHQQNKKVVLIIDEAQTLSDESLEFVRLLTNIETQTHKLLQVVLFAQPELSRRLKQPHLRQLRQRIIFSYQLRALKSEEVAAYIAYRLNRAGYRRGVLFNPAAVRAIARYSGGVPRVINIICHKALIAAYGAGVEQVTLSHVKAAVKDGDTVMGVSSQCVPLRYLMLGVMMALGLLTFVLRQHG